MTTRPERQQLEERGEYGNLEAPRIIGRALRYLGPFQSRFAVKGVLVILTLLPLLFLLLAFGKIGANLQGFPSRGPGLAPVWAIAFHTSLAAMLYLLVQFWIQTPLLIALQRLLGAALLATLTGHRMLRASAAMDSQKIGDKKTD